MDKITIIADYFNVSVDYLLGRTDNISSESNSVSPFTTQKEIKSDGMTNEFFKVFEALDWTDKLDTMQFARDRMRKV